MHSEITIFSASSSDEKENYKSMLILIPISNLCEK